MVLHTFVVLAYKESIYLETCIKSVLNQKYKSDVVIATSTPNDFIYNLANKYNLRVIVNNEQKHGIGYDFDFARTCVSSEMVTIAHQDDIYEYDYSNEVIQAYKKNQDSLIVFTDYFEVRNHKKVYSNTNLKIKRLLLTPLKVHNLTNFKLFKRSVLAFGNSICCPAVTFCNKNISLKEIFASDLKCDVDWLAWERKRGDLSL
ncbi:glycosyltransferase family A protein [uncultured Holdemanella sp.]|uniref:glycosyltransferase family A protein n=1 Tax=uncultured Holdemanella sp. TaxID=1763549 RepID=UPI0025F64D0A|nr:glycosyltransferase family A protein [uncultured Holdemanella sp.]